jgi:transcriptional regulator with XRE-family HTH domain
VDVATERFRLMVEQMGQEEGHAYGWKAKVARRLGLKTAHLSMIMGGKRSAGMSVVRKAIERLGVDSSFFHGEFAEPPHYKAFLSGTPSVERPEPYAALAEFLEGPEGQAATPEEIEDLRAIRWRKQPTVLTYRFALQAVRAQVELTPEEIELNASLRASVIAKGGRIREGE